jgi:hypothetical protein
MAKIDDYRQYVKNIITEYSQYKPSYGDVELQIIFDEERDHYHLMTVGWNGEYRIRGSILHIDIKDGKIWLQHDGTEKGIAHDLLDLGVPKEDIVLAFHSPSRRQFTGFAVN